MSNVAVNESSLSNIATAIRTKLESAETYTLSQMPEKILSISGGAGLRPHSLPHLK